jgi:iron complex outermembrane receptor protein
MAQDPPPAPKNKGVEEVVVTARKRPERLRDLAVTASVISAKKLKQENVSDISDLNKILPAVNINGTFNGRVPLGIRGISSDSNEAAVGVSSGVGIEIDGVPIPSDSFAANNVEDLANVELLEGPQATLGGRTATSGLINYITPSPTDQWHGSLSALGTTDNEEHLYGNVTGPITDKIDFDLSGWTHHIDFPIHNLTQDNNSNESYEGFRAKVRAQITDDFSATLSGSLQRTQTAGNNFVYTYVYPGAYLLAGVGGGPPFWSQQALFPPNLHINTQNLDVATPVTAMHDERTDGNINLQLNYQLGDYAISSLTSYQHEERQDTQDLFTVDEYFGDVAAQVLHAPFFAFNNLQQEDIDTSQVSEELKVATPSTWRLNYVAGIFFSDTNVYYNQQRLFIPAFDQSVRNAESITADPYFHANYRLFENTTLTGGVRFNHDYINYSIDEQPDPGGGPFAPRPAIFSAGAHESLALVGDIGIKQQLTPNWQAYFTYTRGYAPEAYNTARELEVPGQNLAAVPEEKINSFEIGTKGRFFDNTLAVNASLFDTIYNNYQVSTFIAVPGQDIGVLDLSAAGQAETRGGELTLDWQATPTTTLGFNGALVDAEYNKYDGGPCWWAGPASLLPSSCYVAPDGTFKANLSHRPMPNAPKLKFNVNAEQRIPINDRYDVLLGGSLSYRSRAQMLPDQNPEGFEDAVALLNLHATIQRDGGRYAFTVFVNNVTNKVYYTDVEDFWASPWGSNAIVREPARDAQRYAGFRVDMKF